MLVSDVMSTNVVSVSSHTSLAEARRILDAHGFRRLPVVDRGKLVGIVTKDALDRTGPSQLTTRAGIWLSHDLSGPRWRPLLRETSESFFRSPLTNRRAYFKGWAVGW